PPRSFLSQDVTSFLLRLGTIGQDGAPVVKHVLGSPGKAAAVLRRISIHDRVLPDNVSCQSHPAQLSRTMCFKQPRRDFPGLRVVHNEVHVSKRLDPCHFPKHAIDTAFLGFVSFMTYLAVCNTW